MTGSRPEKAEGEPAPGSTLDGPNVSAPDARAAARGGSTLLVVQSLSRVGGLAFVVVATRVLVPSQFGRYSIAASLALLGSYLADAGLTPAVTRIISRGEEQPEHLLSRAVPISALTGVLSAALIGLFVLVASYPADVRTDTLLVGVAILGNSILSTMLGGLDGVGDISRRALLSMAQSLCIAGLGVACLATGLGVRGAIGAIAIAPWVVLPVALLRTRRVQVWSGRLHVDAVTARSLFRTALPFAISTALVALSARLDVVLLSLLKSSAATAEYDLAQRLLESFAFISASVTGPALFLFNRRLSSGDHDGFQRSYAEAARVLYLLGLPLSAGLVVLARPAIGFVLGPDYGPVATPLAIMASGLWLSFLFALQVAVINAQERLARSVNLSAIALGFTIVLDIVLIPRFGASGAAAAMVASWTAAVLLYHVAIRRWVGVSTPLPAWGMLVATAALVAATLLLRSVPILAVGTGALVYCALLLATRAVTRADLQRVADLRHRRAPLSGLPT